MPKFSSYAVAAAVENNDTLLIHQNATNTERQIPVGFLNSNVSSIDDLRAINTTTIEDLCKVVVGGYYVDGDGGGGVFHYDSTSVEADNDGTVIVPDAGGGRWIREYSGPINIRWFGAVGDGIADDTAAIQGAINKAVEYGTIIFFPKTTTSTLYYRITSAIAINKPGITIRGEGSNGSLVINDGSAQAFYVTKDYAVFEDIGIRGNGGAFGAGATGTHGVDINGGRNISFNRVELRYHGGHGIYMRGGTWSNSLIDTTVLSCAGDGVNSWSPSFAEQNGNALSLVNCTIYLNGGNGLKWNAFGLNCNGNVFEANKGAGILLSTDGSTAYPFAANITGNYFENNVLGQIAFRSTAAQPILTCLIAGNYLTSSVAGGATAAITASTHGTAYNSIRSVHIDVNRYLISGATVVSCVDLNDQSDGNCRVYAENLMAYMVNLGEAEVFDSRKTVVVSGLFEQSGVAWTSVEKSDDILGGGGTAWFKLPLRTWQLPETFSIFVETDATTDYTCQITLYDADPTAGEALGSVQVFAALTETGGGNRLFTWSVPVYGTYRVGRDTDTKTYLKVVVSAPGSGTYMYLHDLQVAYI